MARRYWLVKSDPESFSFDDLRRSPGGRSCWDGVRNYQARNYLRETKVGDGVLVYHSQSDKAVMGTAKVVRAGYPDPTDPAWTAIDLAFETAFASPVTLETMRGTPALERLELLRRGSRLSVHPVTGAQWAAILGLGGAKRR